MFSDMQNLRFPRAQGLHAKVDLAINSRTTDLPRTSAASSGAIKVVTWVLFALLLCSVDTAFQRRIALENLGETGEGSPIRQVVYLLGMVLSVTLLIRQRSFTGLARLLPLSLMALFTWAAITLSWSPVPDIGARRLTLTLFIAFMVLALSRIQQPEEALHRFRQVVVTLAICSLAVVIFVPELGIHQPDDPEVLVVGDWRGIFYHKNIFGSVLAPGALIAFYERLVRPVEKRSFSGIVILFLLGMLWMSGSKTSFALTLLLMVLLWFMVAASQRRGGFFLLGLVFYVSMLIALVGVVLWLNQLGNDGLTDDGSFTGRGRIWYGLLRLSEGYEALGRGYQSVFQVGFYSPLASVFSDRFSLTLSQAHNTYIEMLVSIGWIGLLLFVIAIIILPFIRVLETSSDNGNIRLLALALMLFTWLHGLLESGLFDRDRTMWVVFLLGYGALRQVPKKRKPEHAP